jgi:hypothetical protein|tara:strand:- start:870 stop:1631 length:762 start_codon:yes stop_codon:yes gene_type:complete
MGKLNGAIITITIFQICMALFLTEGCFEGPGLDSCTFGGTQCSLAGEQCLETQPGSGTGLCGPTSVTCQCYSTCSGNTTASSFIPGTPIFQTLLQGLEAGACSPSFCITTAGEQVNVSEECWSQVTRGSRFLSSECETECTTNGGEFSTNKATCEENTGTWVTDGWWSALLALISAVGVVGIVAGLYVIKSDFAFYVAAAVFFFSFGSSYWLAYNQIRATMGSQMPDIIILLFFLPVMVSWFMLILDWIRGRD